MNLYKALTLKFSENFEKQSVVSLDLCFTGPKLYSTVPNPTERCQTLQYGAKPYRTVPNPTERCQTYTVRFHSLQNGAKPYSTVPYPTERCQTPQYGVTTDRLRFPIYGSSQRDPAEEDKQRKVVFAFFDHVGREGDSYKPELGSLCNP